MTDKSVIENIETRTRRLIEEHRRLKALCAELTAQRDALRDENRTLERRIRELDAEVARMQLTEGLAGGSSDRDKARARVNQLMREVDKCLALLERSGQATQERAAQPQEPAPEVEEDREDIDAQP